MDTENDLLMLYSPSTQFRYSAPAVLHTLCHNVSLQLGMGKLEGVGPTCLSCLGSQDNWSHQPTSKSLSRNVGKHVLLAPWRREPLKQSFTARGLSTLQSQHAFTSEAFFPCGSPVQGCSWTSPKLTVATKLPHSSFSNA